MNVFKYVISHLFGLMIVILFISCGDVTSEINGLDEILCLEEKDPVKEDDEEDEEEEEELALLSGVLIDAAVEGVTYQSSVSGLTDNLGTYFYLAGDTVSFTIGSINLGSATGQAQITPVDLVKTTNVADRRLVNFLRLIQTLDDDGNPSNGITITSDVRTAAQNTTVNFDQPTTDFASNISAEIATLTENRSAGQTTTLVSASSAVTHFAEVVASSATGGTSSQITVTKNAPTDISLSASSVAENQTAGRTVGTLSGTDPDSGDELTFTLVSGTGDSGNSLFSISGSSLLTAASFDYETQPSYSIRIRATDLTGETYEEVFTVSVTDVDESTGTTSSTTTTTTTTTTTSSTTTSTSTSTSTTTTTLIFSHQAYLKAPNVGASDQFGGNSSAGPAVGIAGDTIVGGAYAEDSGQSTISNATTVEDNAGASDSGAVYIFNE